MFCSKCGSKNDDNAAFCSSCGQRLNAPQVTQNEAKKESVFAATTATGSVAAGNRSTAVAAKRTGKIIGIIFVIVAIALLIATIVTGGFGLMGPMVKASVNDYSWNELSKISAEISEASDEASAIEIAKNYNLCTQDGKLDGTQTKSIELANGAEVDVQIVGFNHDEKSDGSGKAGLTFIFADAIARHDLNPTGTNSGGWEDSEMRAWLAADGMNMLPGDLKTSIVEVEKLTNNTGETKSISSVTSTSDKLWLFSLTELCGKVILATGSWSVYNDVVNDEGKEYKLYCDLNVVNDRGSNVILIKWLNEDSNSWWERSPQPNGSNHFMYVSSDGNPINSSSSSDSLGVVPGFCI